MKNNSKVLITLLCSAVAFSAAVLITNISTPSVPEKNKISEPTEPKAYAEDSPAETKIPDSKGEKTNLQNNTAKKYLLILDNNTICAYEISADGEKKLLTTARVNQAMLGEDDLTLLKNGISADSYENLCFYLESYTS